MAPKDRSAAFVLVAGVVLSAVTLVSYLHFAPGPRALTASPPPPPQGQAPPTQTAKIFPAPPAREEEEKPNPGVPPGPSAAPGASAPAAPKLPPAPPAAKVPAALTKAPTRLSLEVYELTPATFAAWRDYLAGDPKGRLWERIPWRTTLWDAVVDAHAQDRPILLEIHGGNALGRC